MAQAGPSREPACLTELRARLADPSRAEWASMIQAILAGDLTEEAHELLRASRRDGVDKALIDALASRLAPLAEKAQQRRTALWHLDTHRTLIRITFEKAGWALGFDDGDLHAIFLHAMRLEGLRLALDLGKRPKPLLSVGLPLPAGVGGRAETLDVVLRQEPLEAPAALLARLNHRLPQGLRCYRWEVLPAYASPARELAQQSRWRWLVPPQHRRIVAEKSIAFLKAGTWPWARGASKSEGPLDLRSLVADLVWQEEWLCFATRMGPYQAINPVKMLGAIFELKPASFSAFERMGADLKPDPRMEQAERFQPKLKNMYEDAVLLGGGSNITLVDEDDDEPIRLG